MPRDNAANQLNEFKKTQKGTERLTTAHGCPLSDKLNSLTVGARGPILLQDIQLLDEMAHFDRERIPERVVHAKGAGAFGYLEITHDITKYTKAKLFSEIGKRTPLVVRCSTVGGESGSSDTARDPRGFAVKFYTEDGNWDLVGNNTPVFFIRDPILFPSFIHTQKRNPVTHLKDADMFWDFITLRPESTHQVSFLFSGRGTPDGYRHMNGYGSHTFKLVNDKGEAVYCKFHYKTDQGIKNLSAKRADELCGSDPDYAIRDLYNAICSGNYPSYTMYIQVMTLQEAEKCKFNPFDLTKVWPHAEFPLMPVGRLVLDRNPKSYFAEVEQLAFSPANLVPGIEPSPDKMLQARLFAYNDTHRHRLGANFTQIPVNCPYRARVKNYQRDGPMTVDSNQECAPNYYPNSFSGPCDCKSFGESKFTVQGDVTRYNSEDEDNFTQAGIFYKKVLNEEERHDLVENIANHLINAQEFLQERAIKNFSQACPEYGAGIRTVLNKLKSQAASKNTSISAAAASNAKL
ncbi:catalase-like [Homarus americanus]|uniref:catalase-like n=1 Tax=Homarus americanus TaxID=6706 RepID=UPI001C442206|nr:catalase-like [Homarus americanus]